MQNLEALVFFDHGRPLPSDFGLTDQDENTASGIVHFMSFPGPSWLVAVLNMSFWDEDWSSTYHFNVIEKVAVSSVKEETRYSDGLVRF